jgi:hypothetical protein
VAAAAKKKPLVSRSPVMAMMLPGATASAMPENSRTPFGTMAGGGRGGAGAWSGIEVDLTGEPEERLKQHGADGFMSEAFGEVAERTVENATFPVVADPGEVKSSSVRSTPGAERSTVWLSSVRSTRTRSREKARNW